MSNAQTLITTGSFTSDGANKALQFPQGVSWIEVRNLTQEAASQTTAVGVKYYWQEDGFAAGSKEVTFKTNAANAANLVQYITSNGFTLVDTSSQAYGALQSTITAISNAAIPVVSNSGTNGLVPGNIVRLFNVAGAQQLGGIDFTVGYNTLTSGTFSLDYMAQIVAGTTGSWRLVKYDPVFYPSSRVITKISKATQAVVTLSVTHGYKVGQQIRFNVAPEFGMVEMDGRQATIVAINTTTTSGNTITVDIDSSAFTTFAWPLSAANEFTPALVVPVGQNSAESISLGVDLLSDATLNQSYVGLILTGGADCPGGATSDVMAWRAGTIVASQD